MYSCPTLSFCSRARTFLLSSFVFISVARSVDFVFPRLLLSLSFVVFFFPVSGLFFLLFSLLFSYCPVKVDHLLSSDSRVGLLYIGSFKVGANFGQNLQLYIKLQLHLLQRTEGDTTIIHPEPPPNIVYGESDFDVKTKLYGNMVMVQAYEVTTVAVAVISMIYSAFARKVYTSDGRLYPRGNLGRRIRFFPIRFSLSSRSASHPNN